MTAHDTATPTSASGPPALIRILLAEDAARFQALRLQALAECPEAFASSVEEERDRPTDVVAARLAPSENAAVFGAFRGGELVAMTGLKREEARKLRHKAFLWGVYVAPAERRHGTGSALLAHALAHARALDGLRQVTLGVNARNRAAIALYERAGFVAFGYEHGFLMIDGVLHDELQMMHILRPHACACRLPPG